MSSRDERNEEDEEILSYIHRRAREVQERQGRSETRKASLAVARETLFLDRFESIVEKVFKDKIVAAGYAKQKPKTQPLERALSVVLSDLHFHSLLDPREVPVPYGAVEEARRLSKVVTQVADYKRQYRTNTKLYVHLLGDIIQGQLHDMRDGAPLAEQAAAAIYLLVQAISFFSKEFPSVEVFTSPGNHGRNTARHKERATNQKWDSIEQIIYFAIKMACSSLPNVKVHLSYKPYYEVKFFNQRGFFTHGDTVLQPGYPGKIIDVKSIRNQINEINAALISKYGDKYNLFCVGHVHVGSLIHLPNSPVFMTNSCLIPPDPYAMSIGIMETKCGQWLFESVQNHIVGDNRFIDVDEHTDKDKSLDKIIKPFTGF